MRAAFLSCLVLALPVSAQDKKPEKITPENIDVGKVGTIDRLVVEKSFGDGKWIIANFGTVRVVIQEYLGTGIGRGKILPKDQVWVVESVLELNVEDLKGCYVLKPEKKKK